MNTAGTPLDTRRAHRSTNARPRRRVVTTGIVALSAVLATSFAAASAALALWGTQAPAAGGVVTAGDLDVSIGAATWAQTTPGVAVPASGSLTADPITVTTMPGDTLELRIPISIDLAGDNLAAELTVTPGAGATADIAAGEIDAAYRVEDERGATIAPQDGAAALGDAVTVVGLDGAGGTPSTVSLTIVVSVSVIGDYHWSNEPGVDLSEWSLDRFDVSLDQVRTGEGFVAEGAS